MSDLHSDPLTPGRIAEISEALSVWYAAVDKYRGDKEAPDAAAIMDAALADFYRKIQVGDVSRMLYPYERMLQLAGEPFGPLKVDDAVSRACAEPTLAEALSWIAIWDNDRAVRQAFRNVLLGERTPQGGLWETAFRRCFELVLDAYPGAPVKPLDRVSGTMRTIRAIKAAGKWAEIWSEEAQRSPDHCDMAVKWWRLDEAIDAVHGLRDHVLSHGYVELRLKHGSVGTHVGEVVGASFPAGRERPDLLAAERAARAALEAEVVMLCGNCNADGPCYMHALLLGGPVKKVVSEVSGG